MYCIDHLHLEKYVALHKTWLSSTYGKSHVCWNRPSGSEKDDMKSITDNFWHYFLTKGPCMWDGIMEVDKELTAWIKIVKRSSGWCGVLIKVEMAGSYKL